MCMNTSSMCAPNDTCPMRDLQACVGSLGIYFVNIQNFLKEKTLDLIIKINN